MSSDIERLGVANAVKRQKAALTLKLINKEISFDELVSLVQLPENKHIQNAKVIDFLEKMSGWHKNSALYAMTSYNIPVDIKMKDCIKSDYYLSMCSALFNSRSDSWQSRLKAPDGWPWGKDVIKYIIAQYEGEELPRGLEEINNSSRFSIDQDILEDLAKSTQGAGDTADEITSELSAVISQENDLQSDHSKQGGENNVEDDLDSMIGGSSDLADGTSQDVIQDDGQDGLDDLLAEDDSDSDDYDDILSMLEE